MEIKSQRMSSSKEMTVRSSEMNSVDYNFMSERLPSIKNFLRELSFGS